MLLYCDVNNKNDLGYYAKAILSNYLNFIEPSNDSNKSRWPISKFWNQFLGSVERLKLSKQDIYLSITNKRKWLTECTSRSQFEVFVATLKDISMDKYTLEFMYDLLLAGFEKFENSKRANIRIINEYRLQNGYNPITIEELKKIADDLRENYVVKEKTNPF